MDYKKMSKVTDENLERIMYFFAKQAKMGATVRVTFEDIAEGTKLSRSTVYKALQILIRKNIIRRIGGGKRMPSVYEYMGPKYEDIKSLSLRDVVRETVRENRYLKSKERAYLDFKERIFEVKEEDNYYIIKVYKDKYGTLGLP